jgi:hypothetical protein
MSANSNANAMADAGVSAGAATAGSAPAPHSAPRLSPGGYAAWRPLMETFLRRVGVTEKDYKTPNDRWQALSEEVARWSAEEEDSAAALVLAHAQRPAKANGATPMPSVSYVDAVSSPGKGSKGKKARPQPLHCSTPPLKGRGLPPLAPGQQNT